MEKDDNEDKSKAGTKNRNVQNSSEPAEQLSDREDVLSARDSFVERRYNTLESAIIPSPEVNTNTNMHPRKVENPRSSNQPSTSEGSEERFISQTMFRSESFQCATVEMQTVDQPPLLPPPANSITVYNGENATCTILTNALQSHNQPLLPRTAAKINRQLVSSNVTYSSYQPDVSEIANSSANSSSVILIFTQLSDIAATRKMNNSNVPLCNSTPIYKSTRKVSEEPANNPNENPLNEVIDNPPSYHVTNSPNTIVFNRLENAQNRSNSSPNQCPACPSNQCSGSSPNQCLETYPNQCLESSPNQCLESSPNQCSENAPNQCLESPSNRYPETSSNQCLETSPKQYTGSPPNQVTGSPLNQTTGSLPNQATGCPPNQVTASPPNHSSPKHYTGSPPRQCSGTPQSQYASPLSPSVGNPPEYSVNYATERNPFKYTVNNPFEVSAVGVRLTPPPFTPQVQRAPPPLNGAPPSYSAVLRLGPLDPPARGRRPPIRIQPSPPFIAPPPPPAYAEVQRHYSARDFLSAFPSFTMEEYVWGPEPVFTYCTRCGTVVQTMIESHQSNLTHFSALALCLCGCWPCCLLPYCMKSCKNTHHLCPHCQTFLGLYNPWARSVPME